MKTEEGLEEDGMGREEEEVSKLIMVEGQREDQGERETLMEILISGLKMGKLRMMMKAYQL